MEAKHGQSLDEIVGHVYVLPHLRCRTSSDLNPAWREYYNQLADGGSRVSQYRRTRWQTFVRATGCPPWEQCVAAIDAVDKRRRPADEEE